MRDEKPVPMCQGADPRPPAPMTDERLQEIENRAIAASHGPWTLDEFGDYVNGPRVADGERIADVRGIGYLCGVLRLTPEGAEAVLRANGEFITHARQDVPDLVAEVRRAKLAGADAVCKLIEAKGLLLERARENAELLAQVEWLTMSLEVHGAHAVGCAKLAETPNCTCGLHAALLRTPADALALQRARMEVVEAAREWKGKERWPYLNAQPLAHALDALEKLEARP